MAEKTLNKEQLKAVKHKTGPLLIIAGAGTGKTTVITERIKHLIFKKLADPSEILALTFTEKASREMQDRVDESLPFGYTQMWISTFHSFCDKVLKDNALSIGLTPNYKLNTESESIQFFRKHLFEFDLDYFRPLGNPNKFISGMLQHFSRLQDENITPNDYLEWIQKLKNLKAKKHTRLCQDFGEAKEEELEIKKWKELAGTYKKYDDLKTKEGVMDFGDLIIKTLQLFEKRPNILKNYQKQFKYILVDEFQDTNIAQNELVKLLAGENANITVVADDDQAIYRWRGAAISNVIQFRKNYPKAKMITLTQNYRSSQKILDRAYGLIQNNNPDRLEVVEKIDKKLKSKYVTSPKVFDPEGSDRRASMGKQDVEFIHTDRVENEAEEVAKKIQELTSNPSKSGNSGNNEDCQFSDFAILVRANNHAEVFTRALARHGIPYQFLGPARLFKQPEVIDLISYLKILYDTEDNVSLYRLLSADYFNVSGRDITIISNYAKKQNKSLFETIEEIDKVDVSEESRDKINKLIAIITRHFELIKKESAGQILYYFLKDGDFLTKLLNPDSPQAGKKAKNIAKLFDKLKSYEADHEDASVRSVVDWIDLASELGESPLASDTDWTENNAVNILTIHSAKGLEFPVVFLVNLVSQRFPTNERREQIPIPDDLIKEVLPQGDHHLQEERRLFYVGMTRAKEKLFLTAADYYGEGVREKKISPFVFEAMGDNLTENKKHTIDNKQLSIMDYAEKESVNSSLSAEDVLPAQITYLSFSQIETFNICPLHYKLRYIIKIPTPANASSAFGSSIHSALKSFYEKIKEGEKANEKMIISCLVDNWQKIGYTSKSQEEKFFDKGRIYLKGFLKSGFEQNLLPSVLEQSFALPITLATDNLKLNTQYSQPLKVGGRIDRVDVLPDGTIEIIDYKTSAKIPTQKEADENLQLSIYALAAVNIPYPPFNKKPEQVKMSFYYLDTQEKIQTTRTADDLQKAVEKIFQVRDDILKSDFKCSGNILCQNCEYKLFCSEDK